jgi:hypothetical protein
VGGAVDDEYAPNVSGAASVGVAILNPSYAARPDNTGLSFMRYALHVDLDIFGRHLSLPFDLNTFSDRRRKGARVFVPSELDLIGGVTTTEALAAGLDGELGVRVEHDRPVDHGELTQTYADVRARGLYSLAKIWPSLGRDLVDGDISGWLTLGWFAVNPSYAARPDNSGLALLRYAGHSELGVWKHRVALAFDATMFTDRRVRPGAPSELDGTYEIIGRAGPYELHLAYERDMPVDRPGLVQSFVYALFAVDFDLRQDVIRPRQKRARITPP